MYRAYFLVLEPIWCSGMVTLFAADKNAAEREVREYWEQYGLPGRPVVIQVVGM